MVVLFVGFLALKFTAIDPWRHTRNIEKALKSNMETWETGLADIYTVASKIEMNDDTLSTTLDIICVQKTITHNSFKNGVMYNTSIRDFGSRDFAISISASHRVAFATNISCSSLAKGYNEHEAPFTLTGATHVEIQNIVGPILSCSSFPNGGPVQLQTMRVFPTEIVSMRQEPVNEVVLRSVYNPDDSSSRTEGIRRETLRDAFQAPQITIFIGLARKCVGALERVNAHQQRTCIANLLCSSYFRVITIETLKGIRGEREKIHQYQIMIRSQFRPHCRGTISIWNQHMINREAAPAFIYVKGQADA